jgi:hypothetical protein
MRLKEVSEHLETKNLKLTILKEYNNSSASKIEAEFI